MWNVLGRLLHNNPRPSLFFLLAGPFFKNVIYYTLRLASIWQRRSLSPSATEKNLEQTIRCWTIARRPWCPAATMDWPFSPNCSSSSLRQRRQSTASGPPPRIRLAPPLSTAASQVVVRRLLAANCLVLLLSVPKLLARFRKGITRADANEWTRQIQGRPLSPVCPAAPAARPAPVLDL